MTPKYVLFEIMWNPYQSNSFQLLNHDGILYDTYKEAYKARSRYQNEKTVKPLDTVCTIVCVSKNLHSN